jgi:hypothetical protein
MPILMDGILTLSSLAIIAIGVMEVRHSYWQRGLVIIVLGLALVGADGYNFLKDYRQVVCGENCE